MVTLAKQYTENNFRYTDQGCSYHISSMVVYSTVSVQCTYVLTVDVMQSREKALEVGLNSMKISDYLFGSLRHTLREIRSKLPTLVSLNLELYSVISKA